jgi:hypothetical protein
MLNRKTRINILLLLTAGILLYFMWDRYLSEVVPGSNTQTKTINNLEKVQAIHLKKIPEQTGIYGLEILITGTSDKTLMMLFGPKQNEYTQQITLKMGKIDFNYSAKWAAEDCYIYFPSEPGSNVDLKIDYRFLTTTD